MKKTLKIIKYFVIILLFLMIILLSGIEIYRSVVQSNEKEANRIVSSQGIDSLESISLGGLRQWIYIRGENKAKPVLLFLHGGPGSSEMAMASKRYQGRLEKEFVIVHWDQRGAGKTYSIDQDISQFTLDDYITDTVELTNILRNRFNKNKIYLAGHSWGSILGISTVAQNPELYHAYIGIGQVSNFDKSEKISYRNVLETAKKRGDAEAIKELEGVGEPPYSKLSDVGVERKYVNKYGGMIYGESEPMKIIAKDYFSFPHYSTLDLMYRLPVGSYNSLSGLWPWLQKKDMFIDVPAVKIPVYFMLGRHDNTVPSSLSEKYFNALKAPRKRLIWFENSSHAPNYEESDKFHKVMTEEVLADVR